MIEILIQEKKNLDKTTSNKITIEQEIRDTGRRGSDEKR